MGVIRTDPNEQIALRLAEVHTEIRWLLDTYKPVAVSVERIFAQKNLNTIIGVAQASGLVLAEAAGRGIHVVEYSPSAVKSVVAGDGRADKAQVTEMVQMFLGLAKPPKPADVADAAAVALCHLAHDPTLVAWRTTARLIDRQA